MAVLQEKIKSSKIEDKKSSSFQCCSWLITVEEPFIITLKFLKLTMTQCNSTFLTIYDGQNDTFPLLGKYCEENKTAKMKIRSSKNHLFLMVKSLSYGLRPKSLFTFYAKYFATPLEGLKCCLLIINVFVFFVYSVDVNTIVTLI